MPLCSQLLCGSLTNPAQWPLSYAGNRLLSLAAQHALAA